MIEKKILVIHQWNSAQNQFEGKWYVQTSQYSGADRCELKFEENSVPLLDEGTVCNLLNVIRLNKRISF